MRHDVDADRVGVVGQSLARSTRRLPPPASPNCGPFDWGTTLPKMPTVSQEVFRVRSHAKSIPEAHEIAKKLTLEHVAKNIRCPLLVVFGSGDRLIAPAEGERLVKSTSGRSELVVYPEGNHVCFNISYKFRPLTGDWMAEKLGV